MMVVETGVIHGRFQPPHLGHMEYLLAGKARCKHLWIGITNPDPVLTQEDTADLNRSQSSANPYTYFERLRMLSAALLEAGVPREEFDIVPFPINLPHLLQYYVPMDATFFITIYDDWGRRKEELLRSLGVRVEVMWVRAMAERLTSGKEVRKLIASNQAWEYLVPGPVARIVSELGCNRVQRP